MFSLKGVAKKKKVFRTLNTIIDRAPWVYGIPKIVLEFMEQNFGDSINPMCSINDGTETTE